MALLRVDCYLRQRRLVELQHPAIGHSDLAIVASEYSGLRSQYRETIYLAALSYLAQTGTGSREFKGDVKRAIVESFPDAFYAAYNIGGEKAVEPDDDAWLTARITAEVGFVDMLFQGLKEIKDELLPPSAYVDEANTRADGYAQTLDSIFSEGRLRGARNIMLTLDGQDGEESCRTCQRLKGQRHAAKWWASRGLIPGQPGNENYECRGYRCQHRLFTDAGEEWTI